MLQIIREFRVGRAQVLAGLMLLAFAAQCLWAANSRRLSDLEYRYVASGIPAAENKALNVSPLTSLIAALPARLTKFARTVASPSLSACPSWFLACGWEARCGG
jgi:hypothetical protein